MTASQQIWIPGEKDATERSQTLTLPVLPIKNTVLFPQLMLPLAIGRPVSLEAVNAALATEEKTIAVFTQRNAETETPRREDLYEIGTLAVIKKMVRAENAVQVITHGIERLRIEDLEQTTPYLKARCVRLPFPTDESPKLEALLRTVMEQSQEALQLVQPGNAQEVGEFLKEQNEPLTVAYILASMINMEAAKEQTLLESESRLEALQMVHEHLAHEVKVLMLRQEIAKKSASEINKEQRDYMLRRQMRAIQDELGEDSPEKAELKLLKQKLDEANLPEAVGKEAEREIKRLERIPTSSPEYQLTRGYLEVVAELPWHKTTTDTLEIARARKVLDEDHFGLQDVKERILDHLSVMKLNPQAHAPILCFVGPPGVGKTSLGQSIARSLGRKFERLSVGGLHDEAELRGHRRTYIGAMPGRIVQGIRRAGVRNPILLLDEVDKLGRDYRGDPAAAMLEILDPAQNATFRDNYLDLPFDLSKVFFITTANTLDTIPRPLLDRMEILRLSGYSQAEKTAIAKRYLIPRRIAEVGLKKSLLRIRDTALKHIIERYTREAGVRELERMLGRVARKAARQFAEGRTQPLHVGPPDLEEMLGPERFQHEKAREQLPPGVVTGLAWTEAGGDVLFIEAARLPGGPDLTLTGSLGKVMKESARTALSFVRAHAQELGIGEKAFKRSGVHIHVPAGAVPKDGPSAGVAMATALASLYAGRPLPKDLAMTGEITLTGLVLPVGGIKEKVLAAHRAGIRKVILPKDNEKNLREIPPETRKGLSFVFAGRIMDVLKEALAPVRKGRAKPKRRVPSRK